MYTVVTYHTIRPDYRGLDLRKDGSLITWNTEREAADYVCPMRQLPVWARGTYQRIVEVHPCMNDPKWRERNEARFSKLADEFIVTDDHFRRVVKTHHDAMNLAAQMSRGTGRVVRISCKTTYKGETTYATLSAYKNGKEAWR